MALTQISTAGVKDDAVTSGKIPANAVGSSELGSNAVTRAKITDGEVTNAKLDSNSVTTSKINNNAVTGEKLADNIAINTTGTITAASFSGPATQVSLAAQSNDTDCFPVFSLNSTGNQTLHTKSNRLSFNSATGALSATSFVGDGSNLTGITSTTINTNGNDRILTGTSTANTIQGETQLLFDGNYLYLKAPDGGNRYFFGETQNDKSAQLSLYNSADTQMVRIAAGDGTGEGATFFKGGNVGVGTSAPTYKNAVFGGNQRTLQISGSTAPQLRITSDASNQADLFLQAGNSGQNAIIGNAQSGGDLLFSTNNGGTQSTKLEIKDNGNLLGKKIVKTVQDTVVQDSTGDRFHIDLPSTSRMFRITGSFKFDGNGGTYRIWGDFGGWSDNHTTALEGFSNWWVNGATGDLEQDVTSGRYLEVADPCDASNCEVTYDILVTTQAFNGSNSGQRPGVSGNISWTYSQVGRAWTVFSFQDINASGTDRLTYWAWDIDAVSGSMGTGTHHYVIEEYPLTAQ